MREIMDCRQGTSSEVLESYVAGTLDAAAADKLELHLLECPRCVSAVEALEIAREDLATRAAEIRTQTTTARRFDFRVWVPALAAALILLVVGGRLLSRRERPSTVERVSQQVPGSPKQSEPNPTQAAQTQPPASDTSTNPVPKTQGSTTMTAQAPKPSGSPPAEPAVPKIETITPQAQHGEVAQQTSPGVIPPAQPQKRAEMSSLNSSGPTEEQARELFRLGEVRVAPSYAAAGEAAGAKQGKAPIQAGVEEDTGPKNTGASRFQQGMIYYVEKDYRRAGELLELAASSPGEKYFPKLDFYLGVCRLINGHPDEAKAPLQRVIADGTSPMVPAAHLYLAKAYVQQSALTEAESELELASVRPGPVKAEATAMLTRLRALRKSLSDSKTAP